MIATVFMDKLMSMGMSLSVLIGAFVLLFFAYRSNSDGKAIIKNAIQKRNLFIEIVLFFMAIIEGFNAASYAVKEGRDFGSAIAMHVLGGVLSGVFAFAIYKQVTELIVAARDKKHPAIIVKEAVDVVGSIALAIAFPIINSYFIAIAAKNPHDFWNTILFDWGRIRNGSVFYSTALGMAHVAGCFLLSLSSFDLSVLEDSNGGADDPLTRASDSTDDDADIDDDKPEIITTLPVPVSFDPEKVDVENYLCENFTVDRQRLHHRLAVNPTFKKDITNLVTEALTYREEWENYKAQLAELTRNLEANERKRRLTEKSYNHDPQKTTYKHLIKDIKEQTALAKHGQDQVDEAENNYEAVRAEIKSELAVL